MIPQGFSLYPLIYPVELMRFRLVYDGPLPPDPRGQVSIKQDIRRHIHSQLRELFLVHPGLQPEDKNQAAHIYRREFTAQISVGPFTFAALISDKLFRSCYLDILLLRRAKPGSVYVGGDLDNRIKILLDGLRAPSQMSELPPDDSPRPNETPLYCLLDDDKLITGFSVRTDQLLQPKDAGDNDNYARVIVEVSVQVSKVPWTNMPFLAH